MTVILRPDLCVIGGGPGGIAAARAAVQSGAKVILVEKRALGGGVHLRPAWQAQALAVLGARVAALRNAAKFGLTETTPRIDFKRMRHECDAAMDRFMRSDSPARLTGLGIKIVPAAGVFTSPSRLEAGEFTIEAQKFLLALGAIAAPPNIPGLELVRPLTPDRITELTNPPKKLVVIGASHENLVLAQAFLRLGSKVVLLQQGAFLPEEDPELAAPLRNALRHEGMEILENVDISRIEVPGPGLQASALTVRLGDGEAIEASHLLHADHYAPRVESLGLKAAHVDYDKTGPKCNAYRRSSNPKIYAIGDGHHSVESIARARREAEWMVELLFARRPPPLQIARIIGTDPEIAVIGLSEEEARRKHHKIGVWRAGFCDNLREQILTQRAQHGMIGQSAAGHVKILTDSHGHLVGAGIVGPQARELIGLIGLGMTQRLKVQDLATLAAGEATLSEICRTAALASAPQSGKAGRRLFSARRLVR